MTAGCAFNGEGNLAYELLPSICDFGQVGMEMDISLVLVHCSI